MANGKHWLRLWIMLAALSSAAAVASVSGYNYLTIGAMGGIVLGHVYSWRRPVRRSRLLMGVLMALFVAIVIAIRDEFWLILSGTALPLAYLLLLGQALGSFELRSRMSIYRSLILGGLTIFIASEAIASLGYLVSLTAFVFLTMTAMATDNLEEKTRGSTCIRRDSRFKCLPFWANSFILFLVISGLLFWAFPRISVLSQASPGYLPSRMEVISNVSPALPTKPSADANFIPQQVKSEEITLADEQVKEVKGESTAVSQAEVENVIDQSSVENGEQDELWGPDRQGAFQSSQESKNEISGGSFADPAYPATKSIPRRVVPELDYFNYPSSGDTVVMNVRSPVASYWRGQVLDKYDGARWSLSPGRSLLDFDNMGGTRAQLGRARYWQTYYVRTNAPTPLFIGYTPLAVMVPEGGVKVIKRDGKPVSFMVASNRPYRSLSRVTDFDIDELRRDVAWSDDPAYLELPPIPARVRMLARETVQGAATDFDKLVMLEQFLRQNYDYGDAPDPYLSRGESTDIFLFQQQIGLCSQFASSMAVMARIVGLPSRVAIGYRPGAYDLWSGTYTVRTGDAHAWVEIRFRDHGWVPFDPTPSISEGLRPLPLPSWAGLAHMQHSQFKFSVNTLSVASVSDLSSFRSWTKDSTSTWTVVLLSLTLLLVFGGALLIWQLRKNRRSNSPNKLFRYSRLCDPERQRMLRLSKSLETVLAKRGLRRRRPTETLTEYTKSTSNLLPAHQEAIQWLAETASRAAYDPQPFSDDLVREASQKMRSIFRSAGWAER